MEPVSFTLTPSFLIHRLITPVRICIAHEPSPDKPHPPVIEVKGLWDTGAVCTTITSGLAAALGLTPMGFETVYHANGSCRAKKYKVNIILPNGIEISNLDVLEGNLHGCDALIGMDIITQGDFALTHRNGKNRVFLSNPLNPSLRFCQAKCRGQADEEKEEVTK